MLQCRVPVMGHPEVRVTPTKSLPLNKLVFTGVVRLSSPRTHYRRGFFKVLAISSPAHRETLDRHSSTSKNVKSLQEIGSVKAAHVILTPPYFTIVFTQFTVHSVIQDISCNPSTTLPLCPRPTIHSKLESLQNRS